MTEPAARPGRDPVDRLAILAAALPGAVVRQRRMAAPFEAVWSVIADLENATPRYEPGVAAVRITQRHGEFLQLVAQDAAGREAAMEARLRPGWCVMQSATLVVAFAARRIEAGTLLAHLEFRRPRSREAGRTPPGRRRPDRRAAAAKVDRELRTIELLARERLA